MCTTVARVSPSSTAYYTVSAVVFLRSCSSRSRWTRNIRGGLAAWLVLGESSAARRLAGSLIVLAGIAAIAAA
jgi:hypothetical protein